MKPGATGEALKSTGAVALVGAALVLALSMPAVAVAADWSVSTLPGESVEVTGAVSVVGPLPVTVTAPVALTASSVSQIASALAAIAPTSTAVVFVHSEDDLAFRDYERIALAITTTALLALVGMRVVGW